MKCPICETEGVKKSDVFALDESGKLLDTRVVQGREDEGYSYECSTCGHFIVMVDDQAAFLENPKKREELQPQRLAALLLERKSQRLQPAWLRFDNQEYGAVAFSYDFRLPPASIRVRELLSNWPRTVAEKLNRALCNLARLFPEAGHVFKAPRENPALMLAETRREASYLETALCKQQYLVPETDGLAITPAGWARFDELERGRSSPMKPAFVAMWFGDKQTATEMTNLYRQGIEPAVEEAQYRVTRVDLEEHNDFIMDKVLGDIRVAPFVVADFTGHRNGVYFEAGYARGLGTPVIQTCKHSDFDGAHFDTKQLNHILWNDPAELREKLLHRIRATLGLGPYPTQPRE